MDVGYNDLQSTIATAIAAIATAIAAIAVVTLCRFRPAVDDLLKHQETQL